jgi:uncharacterized protein DUF6074
MAASNRIIGERIVNRGRRTGVRAAIVTFPIARQQGLITKIARAMIRKRTGKAADQYLGKALRNLMKELRRHGAPAATIKREVHSMEAQVRAAAWQLLFPKIESAKTNPHRRQKQICSPLSSGAADQFVFPWGEADR